MHYRVGFLLESRDEMPSVCFIAESVFSRYSTFIKTVTALL